MFVLAEMKDVIRVTPEHFHQSLTESITTLLNRKLANKVVLNVGLCIALFDITHIGHSYIFPGDGSSHTEVKFRYIVFRPVVEEILIGKIRSCGREGVHGMSFGKYQWRGLKEILRQAGPHFGPQFLQEQKKTALKRGIMGKPVGIGLYGRHATVTLGFFDDVVIPVNALQHPSRFDETEQAWVWEYPKEDGEKHDLFMDAGETIRFRVTSEAFEESLPTGPPGSDCPVQTVAPYRIVGGINEPGLGLLTWWESPEADDDGDDNEEESQE